MSAKNFYGRFVDSFAVARQLESASTPLAQAQAKTHFEGGHLVADGGRTDIELGLCCGKPATFDDGAEQPEGVHVRLISDIR